MNATYFLDEADLDKSEMPTWLGVNHDLMDPVNWSNGEVGPWIIIPADPPYIMPVGVSSSSAPPERQAGT